MLNAEVEDCRDFSRKHETEKKLKWDIDAQNQSAITGQLDLKSLDTYKYI